MINIQLIDKLSNTLTKNNITWGIGGSYLLALFELYKNPNDLDIWIKHSDISIVRNIFKEFEEIKTKIYLPEEYHFKMLYYGMEVEFVAAFIIKPNQKEYMYNISQANIRFIKLDNGNSVPCTYLEDWYVIYKLLKREDKANIIKEFLLKHEVQSQEIFHNSLKYEIPKYLRKDIESLLEIYDNGLQLSIDEFFVNKGEV